MYYIRFADLITDADLCEMSIPFTCDRRIIQPGSISFEIQVANADIGATVAKIIPQRTIAHVYRNEMIIGSYVVWTKKMSSDGKNVKAAFQGATLESMLYYRRFAVFTSFTNTEQLDIADDLLIAAQGGVAPYTANGDLGITGVYTPSGILRDRTYYQTDGKFVGDYLEELANVDAGFEYIVHVYDNGISPRAREMFFVYPTINASTTPFVIEEPGSILAWEISYDGIKGGTVFWARGDTGTTDPGADQEPILSQPYFADSFLENGYPIVEKINDYQNVSEVSTLDKYAAWWAKNRSGPSTIPSLTVDPAFMFAHGFSPFAIGSNVSFILSNPGFPVTAGVPTMSGVARVIGFELSVDETQTESMKLIIETDFDPTDVV